MTDARGWSSGGPRGALGMLELTAENYEAAYEVVMPAVETYRRLGVPLIAQTFDAAEALAGMGRVEEGRALLDRTKEAPAMMRLPWPAAVAARAAGPSSAADDDLSGGTRAQGGREHRRASRLAARARAKPARARHGPAASAEEARGPDDARAGSRGVCAARGEALDGARQAGARPYRRPQGATGRTLDDRSGDREPRHRLLLEQGSRAGSAIPEARRPSSGTSQRSTASSGVHSRARSSPPGRAPAPSPWTPGISPVGRLRGSA